MNTNEYETIINYLSGEKITEEAAKENLQEKQPERPVEKELTNQIADINELVTRYNKGETVDNFPEWIQQTEKGLKIIPQELFIYIKNNYYILSVKLGNAKGIVLYIYKDGRYILWTESEAKAFIKSFLPIKIRMSKDWDAVYKELITESTNIEEQDLNADEDIINFKNGILKLSTGELLPHSPEYKSTIQIQYNYNANLSLSQAPETLKFLNDITGGNADDITTILEFIGASISNVAGWRYKKMLILLGAGNTGKSVLREHTQNLVGLENTFTVDLKQLSYQFGSAGIYGKRLIRLWRFKGC